jgi:hypothetical protein
MSPLGLIFLIIGVPSALGLAYIFTRGSPGLRKYILTRIALTLPMIFILATVIFFVLRVLPGDPVRSSLGPRGTPEMVAQMREQLGLEDPILTQYGRFLGGIVTFDFGRALTGARRPIADEMGERFPATLELVVPASALALILGISFGALAAARRKRGTDYGLRLYSVIIYAIPVFWLGLILQLIFGIWLGWLPIAGRIDPVIGTTLDRITNFLVLDAVITRNWPAFLSAMAHLILPATHPDQRHRDAATGLRVFGAGAWDQGECCGVRNRSAQRIDPGGDPDRATGGHPAGRSSPDRDGLLLARHGSIPGATDIGA